MTPCTFRTPWRAGALAATLALAVGPAGAQTTDPAPYLHVPPAHASSHPERKRRNVPIVSPHHAGPLRRSAREGAAPKLPPKPEVPVAKALPRKPAPPPLPPNVGPNTGLPLPRYAALKSDDAYMRSGPGERYPVLWTYQRRDLPVRVEHEFDIWRQVEDMDGVKGWMQQGLLVGHRTFVVTGTEDRVLRADAAETADPVAVLKPGVVGRIRACDAGKDWCQVQVQDYRGWLKRSDFWGTDPGEAIAP